MISSFEVFALNRNEKDFIENLNILADILAVKLKQNADSPNSKHSPLHDAFSDQFEDPNWKNQIDTAIDEVRKMLGDHDLEILMKLMQVNYKVLLAAANSYHDIQDKDDFVQTIKLIIKTME